MLETVKFLKPFAVLLRIFNINMHLNFEQIEGSVEQSGPSKPKNQRVEVMFN